MNHDVAHIEGHFRPTVPKFIDLIHIYVYQDIFRKINLGRNRTSSWHTEERL